MLDDVRISPIDLTDAGHRVTLPAVELVHFRKPLR